MSETQLVRYDAMCTAIAAAYEVDEVKHIHDKALALEIYARQSRNVEAERQACEIRLRAERRAGQLLRDREMAKGSAQQGVGRRGSEAMPSQRASALSDLGISHTQSSRWQKLADVPEEEFEATFARPDKPSTTGIITAHQTKSQPPIVSVRVEPARAAVDPRALWLWGRLLDFEREGILGSDPESLFDTMLPHMREASRELLPQVISWLERISEYAETR